MINEFVGNGFLTISNYIIRGREVKTGAGCLVYSDQTIPISVKTIPKHLCKLSFGYTQDSSERKQIVSFDRSFH